MTTTAAILRRVKDVALRVHRDERGAEGLEKLLIIAAIALPLLGVLIFFRGEIGDWVDSVWQSVSSDGQDTSSLPGG